MPAEPDILRPHKVRDSDNRETRASPSSAQAGETSIVVVAEHALVRAGLRAVLDATPGLSVVADAADVEAATRIVRRFGPDVVLLDAPPADPQHGGLDALRRAVPQGCVLCLGRASPHGFDDIRCLLPDAGVAEFCSTLGAILGDRCTACLLRPQCPVPRIAVALSRRERQVAVRVARGLSSKQIAAALGIKLRTVNTYREALARKLGASSPAVVTRYVLEHGLSMLAEEGPL